MPCVPPRFRLRSWRRTFIVQSRALAPRTAGRIETRRLPRPPGACAVAAPHWILAKASVMIFSPSVSPYFPTASLTAGSLSCATVMLQDDDRHLHDDVAVVGGFGLQARCRPERGDHQPLHRGDMVVGRVGDQAFGQRRGVDWVLRRSRGRRDRCGGKAAGRQPMPCLILPFPCPASRRWADGAARLEVAHCMDSTHIATPMPPPMHSVARPFLAPRRRIS